MASGAANSPLTVAITLTISAPPATPTLAASPDSLKFRYQVDRARPAPQNLFVTTSGDPVIFTASAVMKTAGGPWLLVEPRTATANAVLQVSVNPAGLRPGSYDGSINVTASGGTQPVVTVPVQLVVDPQVTSKLETDTRQLTLFAAADAAPQQSQVTVLNPGTDLLYFDVQASAESGNWLSVSRPSGGADADTPATIVVTADPKGLAPGTYSGAVLVQGSQDRLEIPVALTVARSQGVLVLSQTALHFTTAVGLDFAQPAQQVAVLATGKGTVNWSATAQAQSGGSWLSAAPDAGQLAAGTQQYNALGVQIHAAGLSAGEYHGQVQVQSPDAGNSPQVISVVLTVLPQGQSIGPMTYPTGLTFVAPAGAADPAPGSIALIYPNAKSGDQFNSSTLLDPGTPAGIPNWLRLVNPRDRFDPSTKAAGLQVAPSVASLAPGVYRGTVTIIFPGNISRNVAVLLLVTGSGGGAQGRRSAAACVPSQYLPLYTSLEQNFSVALGAPAATGWSSWTTAAIR